MKTKVNPFIKARFEHGYKSGTEFARVINVSQNNISRWERGACATVYEGKTWDAFHRFYKALGWSKERALENLENVHKWAQDPDVELVKPNWEDYKNIVPYIGINPTAGDDVTATPDYEIHSGVAVQSDTTNPLKAWRHENNYSVEDAAKLMEFSPIVLSDIEDGVQKPNAFCLKKIVDISGLSFQQVNKIFIDAQKAIEEEKSKEPEVPEVEEPKVVTLPYIPEAARPTTECITSDAIMMSGADARRLLDIVYGKITLEEYREIEKMIGRG